MAQEKQWLIRSCLTNHLGEVAHRAQGCRHSARSQLAELAVVSTPLLEAGRTVAPEVISPHFDARLGEELHQFAVALCMLS